MFKKENNQLKNLNHKLIDRIDYLQAVIEKEAAASTFAYNYPPKPISTSAEDVEDGGGSKANSKDSEAQKVRKQFEDQMAQQKKNFETQIKNIQISMSDEIE